MLFCTYGGAPAILPSMGPLLSIEEGFDVPRDVLQLVNKISTSTNEPFVNLFNQPVSIRAAADASCIQLKSLSRMKILQPLQIIQLEDAQKLPSYMAIQVARYACGDIHLEGWLSFFAPKL